MMPETATRLRVSLDAGQTAQILFRCAMAARVRRFGFHSIAEGLDICDIVINDERQFTQPISAEIFYLYGLPMPRLYLPVVRPSGVIIFELLAHKPVLTALEIWWSSL